MQIKLTIGDDSRDQKNCHQNSSYKIVFEMVKSEKRISKHQATSEETSIRN